MNSRERLMTVLNGEIPDHVPVSPDISQMIPIRRTGLPYWDIYLYQRIPKWKAYIDSVKYFGFDSLMDGFANIQFEELGEFDNTWTEAIVHKDELKIVTQKYRIEKNEKIWEPLVSVYHRSNPPSWDVHPHLVKLPLVPDRYEPVEDVSKWPTGEALLKWVKEEMGDHGLVGITCGTSIVLKNSEMVYDFYDNPNKYYEKRDQLIEYYEKRLHKLMSLEYKPDFIGTGGSGSLIFQTPDIFRELALPIVKSVAKLCKQYNIPSHVHSCGPETALVKILSEETDLTVIDPLEVPPMGDCDLKELKRLYGDKIVLKGNLHTTDVMLRGSVQDVIDACKRAIDDAAEGGKFILSTGDQCGRDTPDENLFAMIETAKTYGRY